MNENIFGGRILLHQWKESTRRMNEWRASRRRQAETGPGRRSVLAQLYHAQIWYNLGPRIFGILEKLEMISTDPTNETLESRVQSKRLRGIFRFILSKNRKYLKRFSALALALVERRGSGLVKGSWRNPSHGYRHGSRLLPQQNIQTLDESLLFLSFSPSFSLFFSSTQHL